MKDISVSDILGSSSTLANLAPDAQRLTPAEVYIWVDGLDFLMPTPWSYDTFVKENLSAWI